jgi:hypothetical protein
MGVSPVLFLNKVLNELGHSKPTEKQVSVTVMPFCKFFLAIAMRLSVKYCCGVCP